MEHLADWHNLAALCAILGTILLFVLCRLRTLTRELHDEKSGRADTEEAYHALRERFAALEAERSRQIQEAEKRIKLLQESEQRLAMQFENLANRIFEEKKRAFAQMNREGIEAVLSPLNSEIEQFRKRIETIYDSENRDRVSLLTEIRHLKELNQRMGAEAVNLAEALKGRSKLRGNWGEIQLQRILEESGLRMGREYDIQVSLKDENGRRLQPDVIVHLPGRKEIIVDSKVSLVDYERYHSAGTEDERRTHLKAHIASIRSHVRGLGEKSYNRIEGINSLDMVIMFVPVEPALLLAFEHEPELFNEAFRHEILLVGPSTLMATLQIIHNIWRHEDQNRNALEIATEAGKLHDQFVLFVQSLEKTGSQLRKALESYEITKKRLVTGRGNLVSRSVKLRELGARAKKELPQELAQKAGSTDSLPETEV